MKNLLCSCPFLFLFALLSSPLFAQVVAIPDTNFKDRLIFLGIDTNGDGEIQISEAENVTSLGVSNNNIHSLAGIQSFVNLETLHCYGNTLTTIDLTQNTLLTTFTCYGNQFTSLDLSQNIHLQTLNCSFNPLPSLDLTTNTSLKSLDCVSNLFTSLDLTHNTQLEILRCNYTPLTQLDLTQNQALQILDCTGSKLTALNITQNPNISVLTCTGNLLTSLDLRNNIHLQSVYCDFNHLTTLLIKNGKNDNIDFAGNPNLYYICTDLSETSSIQTLSSQYGYTGCTVDSHCGGVGVSPHFLDGFSYFPSPVEDILYFDTQMEYQATLHDLYGNALPIRLTHHQMNLQSLPKGIYLLQIFLGDEVIIKKIIKQ